MLLEELTVPREEGTAVVTAISGLDIQTRLVGHSAWCPRYHVVSYRAWYWPTSLVCVS